MITEDPFGVKPYLCVSTLIEVTPFCLKSTGYGKGKPAFSMNGSKNPPKHASMCRGRLNLIASEDKAGISSIIPTK